MRDAQRVRVVAVSAEGLWGLSDDVGLEALRMLVDRDEEPTRRRIRSVNQ